MCHVTQLSKHVMFVMKPQLAYAAKAIATNYSTFDLVVPSGWFAIVIGDR